MANSDTLIKKYQSDYWIDMKKIDNTLNINGKNINTDNLKPSRQEYILFNTYGLDMKSNANPLINMSLKDEDNKLYLERISLYNGNLFLRNQTDEKKPFEIHLYKKTDDNQFIGQIMFGNAGTVQHKTFDIKDDYSNYLKGLIIYDKCLEFIKNLEPSDKFSQDNKTHLLELYKKEDIKKKLIRGRIPIVSPPNFIIIFWKFLCYLYNIEEDQFLKDLTNKILNSAFKKNFKSNPTFKDVTDMIKDGTLPYDKKASPSSAKPTAEMLNEEIINRFKQKLTKKINGIYTDIENLNKPELKLEESLSEYELKEIVPARYKLLHQVYSVVDTILKDIESLEEKIKPSFAEDEKILKMVEEELREEMNVIFYNEKYFNYLSILPEEEVSLGSNQLSFRQLKEKFEPKKQHLPLRKVSKAIRFIDSLQKYLSNPGN